MTFMDIVATRNEDFAMHRLIPGLPLATALGITVIGCVDPRVDPAHLLGLELGDAAVLRNIGGRITAVTLQTLALLGTLPRLLGARPVGGINFVVLHHTDCGITRMVRVPDQLAVYFGTTPDKLEAKAVTDPYASVKVDIAVLKADPTLPDGSTATSGRMPIPPRYPEADPTLPDGSTATGLVYDVATGKIEIVVPTTPLRA